MAVNRPNIATAVKNEFDKMEISEEVRSQLHELGSGTRAALVVSLNTIFGTSLSESDVFTSSEKLVDPFNEQAGMSVSQDAISEGHVVNLIWSVLSRAEQSGAEQSKAHLQEA